MTSFRSQLRSAAVQLLTDYRQEADVKLQIYPGRPASVNPPTAFVDSIREQITYDALRQRRPQLEIVLLHGLFDSKEAVEQGDQFVDGFLDWVSERYHAAGSDSLVAIVETADDPNYVPDWLPPDKQRSYYATVLTLEGFTGA